MKKLLIPLLGLLALIVAIVTIIYIFIKVDTISHIEQCANSKGTWNSQTNTCDK